MAKLVSKILGVLYFVVGLAGLVAGEDADRYHNLLHLVTGLIALYFGLAASLSGAKSFCLAFGVAYLAFGSLGFAMGNPATGRMWDLGLMSVSMGDHVHHMVLGTIMLAGGIFTKGAVHRTGLARFDTDFHQSGLSGKSYSGVRPAGSHSPARHRSTAAPF